MPGWHPRRIIEASESSPVCRAFTRQQNCFCPPDRQFFARLSFFIIESLLSSDNPGHAERLAPGDDHDQIQYSAHPLGHLWMLQR
jgi:hypothetical protein